MALADRLRVTAIGAFLSLDKGSDEYCSETDAWLKGTGRLLLKCIQRKVAAPRSALKSPVFF